MYEILNKSMFKRNVSGKKVRQASEVTEKFEVLKGEGQCTFKGGALLMISHALSGIISCYTYAV